MGARCTFVFKTDENHAVALYSHWGEDSLYEDLAAALNHARPRWSDPSYGTRMAISYLMQDSILDETGFGIYGCDPTDQGFMDTPITIDFTDNTVGNGEDWHSFEEFVNYHGNVLVKSS